MNFLKTLQFYRNFWWFLIGLIHVSWLTRLIIYESPPAKNKTHWVKDKLWVVDQISFMKRILSLCGWCLTNPTLLLISFPHWTMCSLSPPKTLRLAFVWFSIQKTGRWDLHMTILTRLESSDSRENDTTQLMEFFSLAKNTSLPVGWSVGSPSPSFAEFPDFLIGWHSSCFCRFRMPKPWSCWFFWGASNLSSWFFLDASLDANLCI